MVTMPVIDYKKCNCCGLCVDVCHCEALVIVNGSVTIIETEECTWCTECELVCPTGAIACPFEISIEEEIRQGSG